MTDRGALVGPLFTLAGFAMTFCEELADCARCVFSALVDAVDAEQAAQGVVRAAEWACYFLR